MRVYRNNTFKGHWPVGTSAIVVATSAEQAAIVLEQELEQHGLEQEIPVEEMIEIPTHTTYVEVLQNGDY